MLEESQTRLILPAPPSTSPSVKRCDYVAHDQTNPLLVSEEVTS